MDMPLVSVVVITYCSGKILNETLDSIYDQSYPNIELVISDDHSQDDTVAIAEDWIKIHGSRFQNCIVRVSAENRGITNNINEGIRAASGRYIKTIAGDDLLLEDCILENVKGCQEDNVPYLFTWLQKFSDTPEGRRVWQEPPNLEFFDLDAAGQYRMLLRGNYVYGPLFFFEKAFLENLGLFDERYSMVEDYPMWVRLTGMGNRLHFRNVVTISYRISDTSVSNGAGRRVISEAYYRSARAFFEQDLRPALRKNGQYADLLRNLRMHFYLHLIIQLGNDRSKRSVRIAEFFFRRKYLPGR